MPSQSQGPDGKAGVQGPRSCIDRFSEGEHSTKDYKVGKQEGHAPSYVNVAIVLLELTEGEAKDLCKDH